MPDIAHNELATLIPGPGAITLISGASGGGKSSLLRALRSEHFNSSTRCIDMAAIRLRERPVIDCFANANLTDALSLLSRVGLAEAWTYLKTPAQLSEGQRWRLRLALALYRSGKTKTHSNCVIFADEFAALLDRVTAAVVARVLRRTIDDGRRRGARVSAIVATSHDDLMTALSPDRIVRCDFGRLQIEDQKNCVHTRISATRPSTAARTMTRCFS